MTKSSTYTLNMSLHLGTKSFTDVLRLHARHIAQWTQSNAFPSVHLILGGHTMPLVGDTLEPGTCCPIASGATDEGPVSWTSDQFERMPEWHSLAWSCFEADNRNTDLSWHCAPPLGKQKILNKVRRLYLGALRNPSVADTSLVFPEFFGSLQEFD